MRHLIERIDEIAEARKKKELDPEQKNLFMLFLNRCILKKFDDAEDLRDRYDDRYNDSYSKDVVDTMDKILDGTISRSLKQRLFKQSKGYFIDKKTGLVGMGGKGVYGLIDTADPKNGDKNKLWSAARLSGGKLTAYHVTSDADALIKFVRSKASLIKSYRGPKHSELGPGLYVTSNPQAWLGRQKKNPQLVKVVFKGRFVIAGDYMKEASWKKIRDAGFDGALSSSPGRGNTGQLVIWNPKVILKITKVEDPESILGQEWSLDKDFE